MKWLRSGWALLLGVVFVVVGLALISSYEKLSFMQKMLFGGVTEIGFAFVIAWVVGQTFERAAKAEYNEYIQDQEKSLSQNILMYLFDVDLTKSVFKVVTDSVLSNPIIKENQLVDYSIVKEHEGTDYVTINCFFDYTLKNISEKDRTEKIRFHFAENDLPEELQNYDASAIGLLSLKVGDKEYPPEEFPGLIERNVGSVGQICYCVSRRIPKGASMRVQVSFGQLKLKTDNETWTTYHTCEQLEVAFRFDSTRYRSSIEPLHPSREFDSLQPAVGESGILRAALERPLLPANGFVLWWERLPEKD